MIDGWGISCEIALIWMSLDFTDDQSTLVQVMAWCRQAKAITWANVDPDLCHQIASLGHSELILSDADIGLASFKSDPMMAHLSIYV